MCAVRMWGAWQPRQGPTALQGAQCMISVPSQSTHLQHGLQACTYVREGGAGVRVGVPARMSQLTQGLQTAAGAMGKLRGIRMGA